MSGHRGSRARIPGKCLRCGKQIKGYFLRSAKGDVHIECPKPATLAEAIEKGASEYRRVTGQE